MEAQEVVQFSTPLHQHTTLNMPVNSNGNQSEAPIVIAPPH